MSIIYHDQSINLTIPTHWIKSKKYETYHENESWHKEIHEGKEYTLISKYEEHYGVVSRIFRIAGGIILSLTVLVFAFKSGRKLLEELFFNSLRNVHIINKLKSASKEEVNVHVSIAGNPAHMGHMQMIALGVNRLVQENYLINRVKIFLSSEEYLENKVHYCNVSIEKHKHEQREMFKIFIPRKKRIDFLKAAINQAKQKGVFAEHLRIDYSESLENSVLKDRKIFYIWGADLAEEMCNFNGEQGEYKHAVIISRNGKIPRDIEESHTNHYSRLIVNNNDQTNTYSSSAIQNGAYEQLPACMREEFKRLHLDAQPKEDLILEEIKNIKCPIAQETAIAIRQGFYTSPSGKKIKLRSGEQLLIGSRTVPNAILKDVILPKYQKTTISVIEQDCLEAAEEEVKNGAKKVAVLMLASPIEPGGGMLDGNNGQEEDLCRRSDIFGFMWDQSHFVASKILYNLVDVQRAHEEDPQYFSFNNNRMIHVPQVTVFRSGKNTVYSMLEEPFEIGMLVSPGLDRPRYEKVKGQTKYVRSEDEEQLAKLIMTQLKTAYEENYDTVILGAFGCGAFYNPPELVAKFYKTVIDMHFTGAFRKIIFAILDDGFREKHNPQGNLKPFQECLQSF